MYRLIAFWSFGLVLAAGATIWLRTNPESASAGFLVVCVIENVPPPAFPAAFFTLAIEPLPLYFLFTILAGYLLLVAKLARTERSRLLPRWRVGCFVTGIFLIALTLFGPLSAYSQTFLFVHMIQHFILVTIAPPLLLMGAPLTLLLVGAGPRRRKEWLYPVLHSRVFHALTNPAVGLLLFIGIPVVWYTTPLFEMSLESTWLHYFGYLLFLLAGVHYWWPVVGANPTRWHLPHPVRLFYLFALVPMHAFLGSLFYEPQTVMFPALQSTPSFWGPAPLLDQQIAGAIMFIVGEMLGLIATLVAAGAWARADERAGRNYDRRTAALKGDQRGN